MKASADMDTQVPEQLRREAQAWLRCLTSGRATEQDAQAFVRWREAAPTHLAAFAEARRCWDALHPAIGQLLKESDAQETRSRERGRGRGMAPAWGRRAFIGGAFSVAGAAGVALLYPPFDLWPAAGEWRADYRTATGEQRQIALGEHVSLELNTLTAISRRNAGGRMAGIALVSGEAAVEVRVPGRAFRVTAGNGLISADTGRFEVRHTDSTTCVTCAQGTLRVEHPLGVRRLAAGQQLTYRADSLGGIVEADLDSVSAWQRGTLVFHLTPLRQVIDEINRYRPGRVVLLNHDVAGREMSGYFSIRSLDTVLSQIQHTYGLDARKLPGGLLLLS